MALKKGPTAGSGDKGQTAEELAAQDPELQEANIPAARAAVDSRGRFKPVPTTDIFRPRMMVSSAGGQRSGKTHFGLTMPKAPLNGKSGLAYFRFDKTLEGTGQHVDLTGVEQVSYDFEIPADKNYNVGKMMSEARSVKNQWVADLEYAIKRYRSLFVDTGTWLYLLLRLAHFGRISANKQHYGVLNAEFREWLRMIQSSDCNLLMAHRMKDEYKGQDKTGKQILSGFGEIVYECQVTVKHDRNYGPAQNNGDPPNGPFIFQATDCTQNPELVGQWFEQPNNTWMDLGMAVYPGEDPSIWL